MIIFEIRVKDTMSTLAKLHFAMNFDMTGTSSIEDDYFKMMLRTGQCFAYI